MIFYKGMILKGINSMEGLVFKLLNISSHEWELIQSTRIGPSHRPYIVSYPISDREWPETEWIDVTKEYEVADEIKDLLK